MGPFCLDSGTSSHEMLIDLVSTDEKNMFAGGDVGSEGHKHHVNYVFSNHILTD